MGVTDRIMDLLDSSDAWHETIEHEAVYTSAEAARARGTELRQGAKSLIMEADEKFIMAVISAARRVDMNKLKALAGVSSLRLASPHDVRKLTGCNIGSVPPFGNLFDMQVYVDSSLLENEVIAFNAGSHTLSVKMRLEDYLSIVRPELGDFSEG